MISYSESPVPEAIRLAAENAFLVSVDRDSGEHLICGNVIELGCLTDESASEYLRSQGWLPEDATRPLVMVEYEIWAIPSHWSPEKPENLIYRRDRIFTEADQLVNNELLTLGIGPELNVIEYENLDTPLGTLCDVRFPDQCLEVLSDAIQDAHEDRIIEYFRDGGEMPSGLSDPLKDLYSRLYLTAQAQISDEEERQRSWETAQDQKEKESKLSISQLTFDTSEVKSKAVISEVDGSSDAGESVFFEVPSTHWSRYLQIRAHPHSGQDSDWRVRAAIVRESRGASFFRYAEASVEFVIGPYSSADLIRRELIAQVEDGRMLRRF